MSTKDIKMESIADLMWTEEEEADPNGCVADLGINCAGVGIGLPPVYPPYLVEVICRR